jgi:uncharacterized protein (DUF427 family)
METKKLEMYIAPESEEVKCELEGMILADSQRESGMIEGLEEGDGL